MARKHLHELLQEDQEPFRLKLYIAQKRSQLKRPSNPTITTLQVKKPKPIIPSHTSVKRNLCKNACFLSFQDSPDVRKSPFMDFRSQALSPCKAQNGTVLFQVPALLLEAALRIQKKQQRSSSFSKSKSVGFGLFGSILKKLRDRSSSKSKKREIENAKSTSSVGLEEWRKSVCCSCNNCRLSSAGWSESKEEKSLDLVSCSSSRSQESLDFDAFASSENQFCSSPFRFALQSTPSPGHRTPDFSSPVASPSLPSKEEKDNLEGLEDNKTEDEEKEQCSPVSVLDRSFEEDDNGHDDECGDDGDDYDDLEDCRSYAIVQRARLQLLEKLGRFEKLAELDPVELEKRMLELMDEDSCEDRVEEEESEDDEESPLSLQTDDHLGDLVSEVVSKSRFHPWIKVPAYMKKLVLDLVTEEKKDTVTNGFNSNEVVVQSVCRKLTSWKDVQSNTIDMMVQWDFDRELVGWKKYQEQVTEIAIDIEHEMFRILMEEVAQEHV